MTKMPIACALEKANLIGTLLQEGFRNVAGKENDMALESWPPQMFEVLVFGSVARRELEVGDIDMLVLDNGVISKIALGYRDLHGAEKNLLPTVATILPESGTLFLRMALDWILEAWLNVEDERTKLFWDVPVDLHIYPLELITSPERRAEFTKRHRDPFFFQNVMSNVLVLEPNGVFSERLPDAVSYFERKYETDLSDLR